MARVKEKNLEKVKKNLTPHVENVSGVKFKVAEILREVQELDTDDYVEILKYVMRQPYSKVRFMVQSCADLPIFVKNICSSFLNDTKNGKNYKCSIWLDGDKLKVRGYIGVFYETQTWTRKK